MAESTGLRESTQGLADTIAMKVIQNETDASVAFKAGVDNLRNIIKDLVRQYFERYVSKESDVSKLLYTSNMLKIFKGGFDHISTDLKKELGKVVDQTTQLNAYRSHSEAEQFRDLIRGADKYYEALSGLYRCMLSVYQAESIQPPAAGPR